MHSDVIKVVNLKNIMDRSKRIIFHRVDNILGEIRNSVRQTIHSSDLSAQVSLASAQKSDAVTKGTQPNSEAQNLVSPRIFKKGRAMRVIFFYPGEEGTYVDNVEVTLFDNGMAHIASATEETTTHLQNCEIIWHFQTEAEDRKNKVRLLKPKDEARIGMQDPNSNDGAPSEPTVEEPLQSPIQESGPDDQL